jgi:hypothetical protein
VQRSSIGVGWSWYTGCPGRPGCSKGCVGANGALEAAGSALVKVRKVCGGPRVATCSTCDVCFTALPACLAHWPPPLYYMQGTIAGRRDIAGGRLRADRRTAANTSSGRCFTSLAFSADGSFLLAGGSSKCVAAAWGVGRAYQRGWPALLCSLSCAMCHLPGAHFCTGQAASTPQQHAFLWTPCVVFCHKWRTQICGQSHAHSPCMHSPS